MDIVEILQLADFLAVFYAASLIFYISLRVKKVNLLLFTLTSLLGVAVLFHSLYHLFYFYQPALRSPVELLSMLIMFVFAILYARKGV